MHAVPHDTIAAVSSPPGRSPRGLVRLSGPDTSAVLDHLLSDPPDTPRLLSAVRLKCPRIPALLARFAAPASYTGEDAAELQLPGNAALLDRVLHDALSTPNAGVRLAGPGEFTFRAYTAGKLDLTQAEGIAATIAAVSDGQLAAADLLRRGALGRTAEALVDRLGRVLALVEAGIDFTDQEDVTPIASDELHHQLQTIADELNTVLSRSRSWGAIEAVPRVVLVGPPSAGKSTLFNALLGHERAVIDPLPGTTRDALAEPLKLTADDGRVLEVMLVDLAGLDEGLDGAAPLPDRDAQRAARDAIERADLLLDVIDGQTGRRAAIARAALTLTVLTKQDAPGSAAAAAFTPPADAARISAATGDGLDDLRRAILSRLGGRAVSVQADLLALQPRHEHALREAHAQLMHALAPLMSSPGRRLPAIELLADHLRAAVDALAGLGGKLTPDQVIGRVFASFCVGK